MTGILFEEGEEELLDCPTSYSLSLYGGVYKLQLIQRSMENCKIIDVKYKPDNYFEVHEEDGGFSKIRNTWIIDNRPGFSGGQAKTLGEYFEKYGPKNIDGCEVGPDLNAKMARLPTGEEEIEIVSGSVGSEEEEKSLAKEICGDLRAGPYEVYPYVKLFVTLARKHGIQII